MRDRSTRAVALGFALAALTSLAAVPARAGSPEEHDKFFTRASVGICAGNAELESSGFRAKLDNPGLDVNIAVGYCLIPNLAVHGTLWGWGLNDPDVHISGQFGGTTLANHGILQMIAFGGGATYYVMPVNAYVSSSIGMGAFTGSDQLDGQSNHGFAVDVTAGKEWWVNADWGAGAAVSYSHVSADDKDLGPSTVPRGTWTGTSWALRFTATFN
jgi:hypothetical protein